MDKPYTAESSENKLENDSSEISKENEAANVELKDQQPGSISEKNEKLEQNVLEKSSKEAFKKPLLFIGPRKGASTSLKSIPGSSSKVASSLDILEKASSSILLPKEPSKSQIQESKATLPYKEPFWGGLPDDEYKFEVLKSGVIIDTISLSNKSFFVVGRLPECDISLAHPTISRYHAVIQYRKEKSHDNQKGMYVYDLGSTHGTFWNGHRIKPNVYTRIQGGHIIKFGCSQRKLILQAPEYDQEEESKASITQLKEQRHLELIEKEREESEGIDWGMGEDADEDTDLTENPFAQSNNEDLFLTDPKKTLRGWFDREGLDLHYETEDKGIGRFLCWVNLPLEGGVIRAEAMVTGKKKEAVIQCALEACRILDRHGLLRQANHESRKRKSKNWEENDFYDSDEDSFLDRTGSIEKKRQLRMKLAGKLETEVDTYDTLLKKHFCVTEKIARLENTIAKQKSQTEEQDVNVDTLDSFMSSLNSSLLNKSEFRKTRIELLNLRNEESQLLKLINITKPANLPPLKPYVSESSSISSENNEKIVKNEYLKTKEKVNDDLSLTQNSSSDFLKDETLNDDSSRQKIEREKKIDAKETVKDTINTKSFKLPKKNEKKMKKKVHTEIEDKYNENYSTWVFPEDQKGDGRTSLNDKYGY